MRKTVIVLLLLFASCHAYASPIEKLMYKRYDVAKKSCANRKTDAQKIECLEDMVLYLQAKIDLNYHYYRQTMAIANIQCYNGDLKNCYE